MGLPKFILGLFSQAEGKCLVARDVTELIGFDDVVLLVRENFIFDLETGKEVVQRGESAVDLAFRCYKALVCLLFMNKGSLGRGRLQVDVKLLIFLLELDLHRFLGTKDYFALELRNLLDAKILVGGGRVALGETRVYNFVFSNDERRVELGYPDNFVRLFAPCLGAPT